MKTISDFAPAAWGKNSTGWRMIDAVVPHAATPSMISPAAGSTKGILPPDSGCASSNSSNLNSSSGRSLSSSASPTMRRIKPSTRSVPPSWLIPLMATCPLESEVEVDESYFGGKRKGKRGRGAAGKVPVFGILEREGQVFVEVLPTTRAKDVLALTVKKVRRGSIVYTDRYKSYDALMFCGYRHLCVDHGKYFSRGRVYINGLEGFWSYAKERIMKYHEMCPLRFPYYLKELEFRYNHRKTDLFPLITKIPVQSGAKT